jgi:hypothetical protein
MMKLLLLFGIYFSISGLTFSQKLVDAQEIREVSKFEINTFAELYAPGVTAQNSVLLVKILYETPDISGMTDTASGLLCIPFADSESPFPVILYHHGTADNRLDVPSEVIIPIDLKAPFEIAFASQGYVVVSADYLGLGESRGFHPYVHAETEASASIHLYEACLEYLEMDDHFLSGHLFISGYSQGGHAAMATHRELQSNYSDIHPVTASAPKSGPYSISKSMKDRLLSEQEYFYPGFIAFTLHSYQTVYGNLYHHFNEIFREPYASIIENELLNEEYSISALHDSLISSLIFEHGASIPKFMLQDSIVTGILNNPDHRINQLLQLNDTYDWAPQVPMRLYYCEGDDQVPYVTSLLADSVMNENGALDVEAVSSGELLSHVMCAIPATVECLAFFNSFLEPLVTYDYDDELEFKVYPVPANDQITIQSVKESITGYRAQFFDRNGRLIKSILENEDLVHIPTYDLLPGVYTLRLSSDEATGSQKILIMR